MDTVLDAGNVPVITKGTMSPVLGHLSVLSTLKFYRHQKAFHCLANVAVL